MMLRRNVGGSGLNGGGLGLTILERIAEEKQARDTFTAQQTTASHQAQKVGWSDSMWDAAHMAAARAWDAANPEKAAKWAADEAAAWLKAGRSPEAVTYTGPVGVAQQAVTQEDVQQAVVQQAVEQAVQQAAEQEETPTTGATTELPLLGAIPTNYLYIGIAIVAGVFLLKGRK